MDLSFLTAFANSPIPLLILCVTAIAICYIWKIGPKLKQIIEQNDEIHKSNKKDFDTVHEKIQESISERYKQIDDVFKNIDSLNSKIDQSIERDTVQDKNLDNLIKNVLKLTIYTDNASDVEKLISYKKYRDLGGNGSIQELVESTIIPKNKELWEQIDNNILKYS